jgi:Zn-dependent protease
MTEKKRRVFYSFHDIPGVEKPRLYTGYGYQEFHGMRFSGTEIKHILIAMLVLSFAFTAVFVSSGIDVLSAIAIGFLGIVSAFLLHELGHKFTAQRFGMWAEFRAFPMGLLVVIILTLISIGIGFPIIFAAPGAVHIMGSAGRREIGIVSIAGPSVNFIIALLSFPIAIILSENTIGSIFGLICYINALLAIFNMLPFGPLDGRKVIEWNAIAWAIILIPSLIIFAVIGNVASLI